MNNYCDDFWNDDYSEYELFINELKNTLKGQIKKEVTEEISQLKKELTELKDYKDNLQKYNDEIEDLKNKLKIAEESVTKCAKELRLKDVLKLIEEPVYLIDSVNIMFLMISSSLHRRLNNGLRKMPKQQIS